MTYRRFEDLPVWNAAIRPAMQVYELGEDGHFQSFSGLRNQIERAVLSISNNIAAGFERGTMAELIAFLYIARGSAGEVRSMILLLERLQPKNSPELAHLGSQATDVSKRLGAWINSLENSRIKGTRSMTDAQKAEQSSVRRREEFVEQLRRVQADPRPVDNQRLEDEFRSSASHSFSAICNCLLIQDLTHDLPRQRRDLLPQARTGLPGDGHLRPDQAGQPGSRRAPDGRGGGAYAR